MNRFDEELANRLEERRSLGLFRTLKREDPGLTDFTSNDYLGLARSVELSQLIEEKFKSIPRLNGATGSRLLSGNSIHTEEVEHKLAALFRSQAALIYNSGYSANIGVFSSVPKKGDTILYDELSHASIKDGIRLSLATRYAFRHNDPDDLEKKIKRSNGRIFIAAESIYSMDGDECPLAELVRLAEKYNASIILDEAHSTGVVGAGGNGLACVLGLESKIDIRIYTFGKAMGLHGACVTGSRSLIDYLINFSRAFIYTTSLSPHSIVAIACAFDHLKNNQGLQNELKKKIDLFLNHADFTNRTASRSAIQTLIVPGNQRVKEASRHLQSKGWDVRPILSPTVPENSERLRIILHTFNHDSEVTALAKELQTFDGPSISIR